VARPVTRASCGSFARTVINFPAVVVFRVTNPYWHGRLPAETFLHGPARDRGVSGIRCTDHETLLVRGHMSQKSARSSRQRFPMITAWSAMSPGSA